MMDIQEIMAILPHRYPFLLVDRILSFEPGQRMTAIKNVSMNEPFFQGHFPGHPIMPGVLIIEAMAQIGGVLELTARVDVGVVDKFRKPVLPGDQLTIEVEVLHQRPPYWKLKGKAYVNDQLVSEAELKAMLERENQKETP